MRFSMPKTRVEIDENNNVLGYGYLKDETMPEYEWEDCLGVFQDELGRYLYTWDPETQKVIENDLEDTEELKEYSRNLWIKCFIEADYPTDVQLKINTENMVSIAEGNGATEDFTEMQEFRRTIKNASKEKSLEELKSLKR